MTVWLRLALVLIFVPLAGAYAAPTGEPQYAGRPLEEVLRDLSTRGLRIVFSSEFVRPEMKVLAEPRSRRLRGVLEEILRAHGLATRSGPKGTVLVVRQSRRTTIEREAASTVGILKGRVVDADTGVPLPGVIVAVGLTDRVAETDTSGQFELATLPTGKQELFVSSVGYALARPIVDVLGSRVTEISIPLASGTRGFVEQVTVTGHARETGGLTSAAPATVTLGSGSLQELRGVLADDPLRAAQALPGVVTGDDFRAEFSMRGVDFRHMGVSLDGIQTDWLVHSVRARGDTGSISMLNGDVLEQLTLSPGAYRQVEGSGIGPWLAATTREGSRDGLRLQAAISGTSAAIMAEGPVGRARRGSWLASVRQSYLDWLLRHLDSARDSEFGFSDVQGKLVFDVSSRQRLEVSTLGGRSRVNERNDDPGPNSLARGTTTSSVTILGHRLAFGSTSVLNQKTALATTQFENVGPAGQRLASGDGRAWTYRADLAVAPNSRFALDVGGESRRLQEAQTIWQYGSELRAGIPTIVPRTADSGDLTDWQSAAFGSVTLRVRDRLTVSPGLRVSHSTVARDATVSPWVITTWWPRLNWTATFGAGVYRQWPDPDQWNPSSRPDELQAEQATHVDLSLQHQLRQGVRWQVNVFGRFEHDALRLHDAEPRLVNGILVRPSPTARWHNTLEGHAAGAELSVERTAASGLTGWIGYAFGRARYTDQGTGERYWADFDQRHTVNAFAHHRLSPRTSVTAKFRLGSNVPVPGYFDVAQGMLVVGETRNTVRLPTYARLDARVNRTFNFTRRRLTLFVEVLNIFNRSNPGLADGVVRQNGVAVGFLETLFPILPSAGVRFEF
jgi:hypothetical protein